LHSYAARAQERLRSVVDFNLRVIFARESQAHNATPDLDRMARRFQAGVAFSIATQ